MRALNGIDANPQLRAVLRIRFEKRRDQRARLGLLRLGHRILEIENHDVRIARRRLCHLALAIAWGEQPGTQLRSLAHSFILNNSSAAPEPSRPGSSGSCVG